MIPLGASRRLPRAPWMTRAIVAVNVAAFIWELSAGNVAGRALYQLGVVPSDWQVGSPSDFLDWPRLFLSLLSAQFLHAGALHLWVNLHYLWVFGGAIECRAGSLRFLLGYLGCGVLAAVTQILIRPHGVSPMVGASGAVAGVLGAFLVLAPGARIRTLGWAHARPAIVELPGAVWLAAWFLLQWGLSLAAIWQVTDVGGVAVWAHLGGFVGGIAWGRLILWQASHQHA
ncbi:MAG TPA: rhomboid family intramembrane serine protease [bacterium]